MPYKLIYFFGPDGTGKTTHADLTSLYLRRKGYRTWRASVKQHHTFSYLFLKILGRENPEGQAMSYHGFEGELVRRIRTPWKILELISLLPAVLYRVLLPLLLGFVVVCDRYVLDTLVTLSYFVKEPKLVSGAYARLLVKLIPGNSVLIYFDADTDTILRRKNDEPLTEQLIEYYKKTYRALMKWSGLSTATIDTSVATIEEIQGTVMPFVNITRS